MKLLLQLVVGERKSNRATFFIFAETRMTLIRKIVKTIENLQQREKGKFLSNSHNELSVVI